MLDRLMSRGAIKRDVLSTNKYRPENVIRGHVLSNEKATRLTVLFPPWHGAGWAFNRLTQRLVGGGSAVLAYSFHDELLKPDATQVLASFDYLQTVVTEELHELVEKHGYQQIHLVGASLGNIALAMVAEHFKDFSGATLVTPGSNLAACMWEGIRTQHVRSGIEKQGYTKDTLDALWQPLAPINHANAFKGKPVHTIVSTTDEIIPYRYQEEFVNALRTDGADVDVIYTRLGHLGTIGRYCVIGNLDS